MNRLNAAERETIILYNEAENTAEIETCNVAMKKRLANIRRTHPKEITLLWSGADADYYIFPKKWIKIIPPRRATEKQREHLEQARSNRNI